MMNTLWRQVRFWLAGLVLAGACLVPTGPVLAQAGRFNEKGEPEERHPPALQYSIAIMSVILILCILCIPSRKRVVKE